MKKPNIMGIIHNMIWFVCACLSSAGFVIVIFWVNHIEPPTRTGSKILTGAGWSETFATMSRPRKSLLKGMPFLAGFHE